MDAESKDMMIWFSRRAMLCLEGLANMNNLFSITYLS